MNALPRLVSGALAERLAVMPAVVVTGARQTGKSTLAEQLVQGKRLYRTLDDFDVLDAARREAGYRSEPQRGSLPADRFGEPALDAPGFRIARWPAGTRMRRTGVRWRIRAAFPHQPSSWPVPPSAPSCSTATWRAWRSTCPGRSPVRRHCGRLAAHSRRSEGRSIAGQDSAR